MEFDLIQYYCREKYYRTMRLVAESALKTVPDDPVMKLQYCAALIFENRIGEALRELEFLSNRPDVTLAVIIATIHAQNLCEVPDGESLITLENRLKIERKRANELALYYAATLYIQLNSFEKAWEFMDMIFRLNRNSSKGFLIKGWLELHEKKFTIAADCFRNVLSQNPQNLGAMFGEVLSLSVEEAITKLNQMIVKWPNVTPPLIEKMKLLTSARDWEQAVDTANRILEMDSSSIPALQLKVLYNVCVRGRLELAKHSLTELMSAMKTHEPGNWHLNYEFGTLLSRLCGYDAEFVRQSVKFVEEAAALAPTNFVVNVELAHQTYLLKDYKRAIDVYKKVARMNDTATDALIGLIKCRLITGEYNEEIKQQIDFLLEVDSSGSDPDLLLLQSYGQSENIAESLLTRAIDVKFKSVQGMTFGTKYLTVLDVTFILDALKRFPNNCNEQYRIEVLKKLIDIVPGLTEAWLMLASIYLDTENLKDGETVARHILSNLNASCSDAHLKLAQILIRKNNYEEAGTTLNMCLSQNLNIRSNPLFHYLTGKIHKYKNNVQECINSMLNALQYSSGTEFLKPLDMASLYLDLSSSYQMLRQADEASEAIQKATHLLEGTSQVDRIVMARVDLELWKNDATKALALLSSITADSPLYLEARTKMADVYLKFNKDTTKYIECYKELSEENPTQENLIKLAEAYFSIRKIMEAVTIYEKAIKKNPSSKLYRKLAELYCKCHQYGKAMRCYREAGPEANMDLAQLLYRLEQWQAAEITLSHVPLHEKALLLSKIKEKLGDVASAINILNEAYKRVNRSNDALAAQLCCEMAEHETNLHDFDSAIRHYKLALSHSEGNENEITAIQISLSKLYLQINDWSSCQSICSALLGKDANNELALLMSADLSFRKCDFVASANLFHKLLSQKSDYWLALARMVEVKRRLGVLHEAAPYLERAAAADPNDSGLSYCSGLFNWYGNNLQNAVKYFSAVKHDPEWGQQALHNMVQIYLSGYENHETAESLLKEIKPNSPEEETNRSLLANFVLLASKDKQTIEKAMNELTSLASRDVLRVGASLGLAMGYTLQKQPQRARNVLKIIAKTAWQFEEAEYLERCWIMLAEHYVHSGKHELAYELIKKILTYNLGCSKAHELYGMIAEKDHKYGDPAMHYLKAWTASGHCDPNLGYRLGMYLLKCKRYADSISTCQTVLKKNPNNTKIKKDVYEKALSLLRT